MPLLFTLFTGGSILQPLWAGELENSALVAPTEVAAALFELVLEQVLQESIGTNSTILLPTCACNNRRLVVNSLLVRVSVMSIRSGSRF